MKVSVVIPTFNRAHLLRRAIDSVLAQSYHDFELIVVDDGSSDDTAMQVESYKHHSIRFLRHPQNRGQNAALNTGVASAQGVFCAILDSDDTWQPEYLARMIELFERTGDELGCVYCWAAVLDSSSRLEVYQRFSLEGNIYPQALAQGYVSHMITLVVRRELLLRVGMFDEAFDVCQDDDICLRLARETAFGLVQEPLAIIHQDAGDQVTGNPLKYAEGAWRLVNKFKEEMVTHCESAVLARHYERCGDLFWLARDREKALFCYSRSFTQRRRLLTAVKSCVVRFGVAPEPAVRLKQMLALPWGRKL